MSTFRRVLTTIAYIATAGTPLLVVGGPWGAVLGAVGVAAGAVLHFTDNPTNTKAAVEAGTTVKAAIDAVRVAKGLPKKPGKGQSGS